MNTMTRDNESRKCLLSFSMNTLIGTNEYTHKKLERAKDEG